MSDTSGSDSLPTNDDMALLTAIRAVIVHLSPAGLLEMKRQIVFPTDHPLFDGKRMGAPN